MIEILIVDLPSNTVQDAYDPCRVAVKRMRDILMEQDYLETNDPYG